MKNVYKFGLVAWFVIVVSAFAVGTTNLIDENGITTLSVSSTNLKATTINMTNFFIQNVRPFRNLVSDTVYVCKSGGRDYTTIQAAMNELSLSYYGYKKIIIEACGDGIYDEDVIIWDKMGSANQDGNGEFNSLTIVGNESNSTQIKIRSIYVNNQAGSMSTSLGHFQCYGQTPYDDEASCISIYSKGTVTVGSVTFNNGTINGSISGNLTNGITCYDSSCYVAGIDFGSNQVAMGIRSKYNAMVYNHNLGINGTVKQSCFYNNGGFMKIDMSLGTCTGSNSLVDSPGGFTIDKDNSLSWGLRGTEESTWTVRGNAPVLTIDDVYATGTGLLRFMTNATNADNYSIYHTSSGLYFYNTNTTYDRPSIFIKDSGDVCINKKDCDKALDVNGSVDIDDDLVVSDYLTVGDVLFVNNSNNRVGIGTSELNLYSLQIQDNTARSLNVSGRLYVEGNTGDIGINIDNPTIRLDVRDSDSNAIIGVYDTTNYAVGVGGSIDFKGYYNNGGSNAGTTFGRVKGYLDNAASGQYGGGLRLSTVQMGVGTVDTAIEIQPTGKVNISKSDLIISKGNITMFSPDGTEYNCGVANGGSFTCT